MIVEIWRKPIGPGLPVCFTVGNTPQYIGEENNLISIIESPDVKSITFYETGAFQKAAFGPAYHGPCYVIQFEDSNVRRIIPQVDVRDICWASAEKTKIETPALEA